ncbi:MAG: DUF2157 domain-containing protein [Planctomycetes bacterium]|nr:DUF2157 domain-containing protein [Planctomycetota bacterium]
MKNAVDPLDLPADAATLATLRAAGVLDARAHAAAWAMLVRPPRWWRWVRRLLLGLGTCLVLAGAVFFLAYNWADLGRFAKLGLVQALLVGCAGAAWALGPTRLGGQLCLCGAALFTGLLLAVFGQVYQTGADVWNLFAAWTALALGWVLVADFPPLWIAWLALGSVTWSAAWQQALEGAQPRSHQEALFVGLAAIAVVGLVAYEVGRRRGLAWLADRWPRALLVLAVVGWLACPIFALIVDPGDSDLFGTASCLAYVGVLVLGDHLYRRRELDLPALAIGALSVCLLVVTLTGKLFFEMLIDRSSRDEWAWIAFMLLEGLVTLTVFALAGRGLLRLARASGEGAPNAGRAAGGGGTP